VTYYGVDWAMMAFAIVGTYGVADRKRWGFLVNAVACICGLCLGLMIDSLGMILLNGILCCINIEGYMYK